MSLSPFLFLLLLHTLYGDNMFICHFYLSLLLYTVISPLLSSLLFSTMNSLSALMYSSPFNSPISSHSINSLYILHISRLPNLKLSYLSSPFSICSPTISILFLLSALLICFFLSLFIFSNPRLYFHSPFLSLFPISDLLASFFSSLRLYTPLISPSLLPHYFLHRFPIPSLHPSLHLISSSLSPPPQAEALHPGSLSCRQ